MILLLEGKKVLKETTILLSTSVYCGRRNSKSHIVIEMTHIGGVSQLYIGVIRNALLLRGRIGNWKPIVALQVQRLCFGVTSGSCLRWTVIFCLTGRCKQP
jgi:hypothetical protein